MDEIIMDEENLMNAGARTDYQKNQTTSRDCAKTQFGKINPDYYRQNGLDLQDILKSRMTSEEYEGWLVGCIMKYMTRYKHKDGVKDLEKARWNINCLIDHLEKDNNSI